MADLPRCVENWLNAFLWEDHHSVIIRRWLKVWLTWDDVLNQLYCLKVANLQGNILMPLFLSLLLVNFGTLVSIQTVCWTTIRMAIASGQSIGVIAQAELLRPLTSHPRVSLSWPHNFQKDMQVPFRLSKKSLCLCSLSMFCIPLLELASMAYKSLWLSWLDHDLRVRRRGR